MNHSWHVTLYVTARGLTTSPIPYGTRTFEIDFDFIGHRLTGNTSDGGIGGFALEPQSVATFYARLMEEMAKLDLHVKIDTTPNEVADPSASIRTTLTARTIASTPTGSGGSWCRPTASSTSFAPGSWGKCSPVHFFWGAPDLAVTRFSGRRAPEHPGGIRICRTG